MASRDLPDLDSFNFELAPAPCAHYDSCGGCGAQHVSSDNYKNWKTETLKARLALNTLTPETWGAPVFIEHSTRRRATLAVHKESKNVILGFHGYKSHEIEPVEKCMLLTTSLNQLIAGLKPWLGRFLKDNTPTDILIQDIDGQIEMIIIGNLSRSGEADTLQRKIVADMCEALNITRVTWQKKQFSEIVPVISNAVIVKAYGDLKVDIPPGAFLQPSQEGEGALVSLVMEALPKKSKLKIADLFAGCGTFTGPALNKGQVHAVEQNSAAVIALQSGVKRVQGLTVEKRDLMAEPMTVRELKNYDVVILDPPRAGAGTQCEKLAKSTVGTVISVSCNPSTFCRDAKILIAGGYKFKKLTMVDQFIWSEHTEVVGVFTRS